LSYLCDGYKTTKVCVALSIVLKRELNEARFKNTVYRLIEYPLPKRAWKIMPFYVNFLYRELGI
jgi:hypothetical protein